MMIHFLKRQIVQYFSSSQKLNIKNYDSFQHLIDINQDADNQSTSDEFSGGGLLSDDTSSDSSSSDSDDDRGLQLRAPKRSSQALHHRGGRGGLDSHHQSGTSKLSGHKQRLSARAMSSSSDIASSRRTRRSETPTRKHGGHTTGSGRY